MARVTTVTNQKGGVGKTTTAHAMATGLLLSGYKVLAIDMDPQGNLSYTMGADITQAGIYEAMRGDTEPEGTIQTTDQGDIIPSSLYLAGADMEFTGTGREYLLRDIIEPLKSKYDFIIIDTPPQLGILTINALTASGDLIITMGADIYSLQGIGQLHDTIRKVKQYCNPFLSIAGLLITRYNGRAILSKDLKDSIDHIAGHIGARLYNTVIREGIAIKETQAQQASLFDNAPKSNPAKDYLLFLSEYLKGETEQ